MEFLLNIALGFTPDVDEKTRDGLLAEEHLAGLRLRDEGQLVRMWRVPGTTDNWSVWQARDATHLHELVSALPLFPWMTIAVHPLAEHPLDQPAAEGA
jgi:muconolactone D-isomerase